MNNQKNVTEKRRNPFIKFVSTALIVVMVSTAGYVGKIAGRNLAGTGNRTGTADTTQVDYEAPEVKTYDIDAMRAKMEAAQKMEVPQLPEATEESRFDKLLEKWNVTHEPHITAFDTEVFAHETEDGLLEIIEVGHKNDIVQEMVNVIYYDVSGKTEEEKMQLLQGVMNLSIYYGQWQFVTMDFEETDGFFKITLDMKHLDQAKNVQGLAEMGLANADAQELRMSLTTANFLLLGYYDK